MPILRHYAGRGNLVSYLATIVERTASHHPRGPLTFTLMGDGGTDDDIPDPAAMTALQAAEVRAFLEDDRLPLDSQDREILVHRVLEDWPYAAIAAKLGISEAVARQRARRALTHLRQWLAHAGGRETPPLL